MEYLEGYVNTCFIFQYPDPLSLNRSEAGRPRQDAHCPQCGANMLREGSKHCALWQTRRAHTKGG